MMDTDKKWLDMLKQTLPKDQLLAHLTDHPDLIPYTVHLSCQNLHPESWRAAWLIQHICHPDDPRIIPHLNAMIHSLSGKADGHQRELLKTIQKMSWDEDREGLLFDHCIKLCSQISKSPSIRITAFHILTRIVRNHPELWPELELITGSEYLENLSPGIRRSLVKSLDQLRKDLPSETD